MTLSANTTAHTQEDKMPLERRNSRAVSQVWDTEGSHIQERRVFDFLNGDRAIRELANTKEDRIALARAAKIIVRTMLNELEQEKKSHILTYGKTIPFDERSMSDSLRRRIALIAVGSRGRSYRDIQFLREEENGEELEVPKKQHNHTTSWLDEIGEKITDEHVRISMYVAGTVLAIVTGLGVYEYTKKDPIQVDTTPEKAVQETPVSVTNRVNNTQLNVPISSHPEVVQTEGK